MTEDERMAIVETKLSSVIDNQGRYEEEARDWRNRFCNKLDRVIEKIDSLPCPSRIEQSKGINLQLKALWALTGGMLLAIISEWIKLK